MEKTAVKRVAWIRDNPGQPFDNIIQEYPRLFDTPGMVSTIYTIYKANRAHLSTVLVYSNYHAGASF